MSIYGLTCKPGSFLHANSNTHNMLQLLQYCYSLLLNWFVLLLFRLLVIVCYLLTNEIEFP
jgi:hypothetical protein